MAEDDVRQEKQYDLHPDAVILPKNASEVLVVQSREFKCTDLLDARVWTADAHGKPEKPTKKGLCLRPELWRELLAAIQAGL